MPQFWLENSFTDPKHTLVDLGYVNAQSSRDRADRILRLVSKKNLQIAGFGRLLVRIPPKLVNRVLEAFPEIQPKNGTGGYFNCTHVWNTPDATAIEMASH